MISCHPYVAIACSVDITLYQKVDQRSINKEGGGTIALSARKFWKQLSRTVLRILLIVFRLALDRDLAVRLIFHAVADQCHALADEMVVGLLSHREIRCHHTLEIIHWCTVIWRQRDAKHDIAENILELLDDLERIDPLR